jgi:hypothetical protein
MATTSDIGVAVVFYNDVSIIESVASYRGGFSNVYFDSLKAE